MVPGEAGKQHRALCEELVCNVLGAGLSPNGGKLARLCCHCSGFLCIAASRGQQSPGTAPSTGTLMLE